MAISPFLAATHEASNVGLQGCGWMLSTGMRQALMTLMNPTGTMMMRWGLRKVVNADISRRAVSICFCSQLDSSAKPRTARPDATSRVVLYFRQCERGALRLALPSCRPPSKNTLQSPQALCETSSSLQAAIACSMANKT